jgi:membrane associated rhomboid family serine protease
VKQSTVYTEKEYKQRISLGQSNNALTRLIIINLVFFVLLFFTKSFFYFIYHEDGMATQMFNARILKWFVMPADLSQLAARPWTILTSFFVHTEVWNILANMLWLWTFGYIMQDLTGNKKIIPVFVYGGLVGALVFSIAYHAVPALAAQLPSAVFYGSSAGVAAVASATTMVSPGYRIFPRIAGGIPLWALTVIYFAIAIATVPDQNIGGFLPYGAGAFTGVAFILLVRSGYDGSEWMNNFFDWVNNLFNPDKPNKGKTIKDELFYKQGPRPFKKTPNITQQRIDDILDKINQKGYSFLTDEEKELLKRASKEDL